MVKINDGPRHAAPYLYYTPDACRMVEAKFRWAFHNLFRKWQYNG